MIDKVQQEGASVRTTQILRNILSKALKPAEAQGLVKKGIVHLCRIRHIQTKGTSSME